jgi:diaminopimelate decarboxylase
VDQALELAERAGRYRYVDIIGVHQHIGSQITKLQPFRDSVERSAGLVEELQERGFDIRYFNIGGGLGIRYKDEEAPTPKDLVEEIRPILQRLQGRRQDPVRDGPLHLGRRGRPPHGRRLPQDERREGLYSRGRRHERPTAPEPLRRPPRGPAGREGGSVARADLVGPVCESGDYLARDRELPDAREGDVLAVMDAGAYGFSMASNYNSRPRPAEVMVSGDRWAVVREREHNADLVKGELVPAFL